MALTYIGQVMLSSLPYVKKEFRFEYARARLPPKSSNPSSFLFQGG